MPLAPSSSASIDRRRLLASLAAARLRDDAAPDSFNVLTALLGESRQGRPHLVEHAGTLSLAAGKWKYVAPSQGPRIQRTTNTELGNDPAPQLYDLDHDPGERVNLAARYPVRVREMAAQLEKIRAAPRTRP